MWKKVLREYFAFPRKERRGIAVLFIVWLSILIYTNYRKRLIDNFTFPIKYKIIISEQIRFEDGKQLESINNQSFFKKKNYPQYFNYVKETDLLNYGIQDKSVKQILSLRNSGLKIFTQIDLINSSIDSNSKLILLKRLKFFPEKKYFDKSFDSNKERISIDLNTADTNAIDQLKGMSRSMARRVCKYRERLGGFISIDQLKEVWGMDSASYDVLKQTGMLQKKVKKININTSDVNTLGAHPYIGYGMAKLIVNYRVQHGDYSKIEDLYEIHVMNADIFSKIEAYITTSND